MDNNNLIEFLVKFLIVAAVYTITCIPGVYIGHKVYIKYCDIGVEYGIDPDILYTFLWPIGLIKLCLLSDKRILIKSHNKYGRKFHSIEQLKEYEQMIQEARKEV